MKTKQDFLAKVQVGSLIAFRIGEDVYSGKVIEVRPTQFIVRTKSCSIFFVDYQDFIWLKTGTKWPEGIYNALRYRAQKSIIPD